MCKISGAGCWYTAPVAAFPVFVLYFSMVGCGGGAPDDMPELGLVTGQVKMDGQPLADATVYFHPAAGGKDSVGKTDAHGNYELIYRNNVRGAKIGMCVVSVCTASEAVYDDETGEQLLKAAKQETVHPDFNDSTGLQFDVKPGESVFDITVTGR